MAHDNIEWEESIRNSRIIETSCLFFMVAVFLLSIMDCKCIKQLIDNNMLSSQLLLTIIQVQATIGAISIALVAIISGYISTRYHGISVPYVLSEKEKSEKHFIIHDGVIIS